MISSPRNLIALLITATMALTGSHASLVNGPMLGPTDMREASIWVQTKAPSIVRIVYTENGGSQQWSRPVETDSSNGNTAVIKLDEVKTGKNYSYQVEINGDRTAKTYSFKIPAFYHDRTPPPDFRVAVGGAHYATEEGFEPPYQMLGGGYGIFNTIFESKPDMMLWLGNTAHLRQSDWASKSGILKRYGKARSISELGDLLANIPNYATWGSSDYSITSHGRSYSYREHTESSFKAFWPQPVKISALDGIATRFRYADVDFFMLDVRSYRNTTPTSTESPQILGQEQIEWLRQEIIRSDATFKIIAAGSPILNPADSEGNLSYAEREHTNFLQTLRDERIDGLFFLSGGKYYGELTRLVHANSYNLYDLTVGPLTAAPEDNSDELNFFRMPGTSTFERQFALLDVSGPEEERKLTIRVMSMEGKELWNRDITASQLQPANK